MVAKIELNISPQFPEIELRGWSVNEEIVSIAPGEDTPAFDSTTFSGERDEDDYFSEWAAGSGASLRYDSIDNNANLLGGSDLAMSGTISNITTNGLSVNGSFAPVMERLSQTVTMPAFRDTLLSDVFNEYFQWVGGPSLAFDLDSDPVISVPGWTDTIWSKVNDLCIAYGLQMNRGSVGGILVTNISSASNSDFVFDPIGVPKIITTFAGNSAAVELDFQNTESGALITWFDALQNGNRIISVDVGEIRTDVYDIDVWPNQGGTAGLLAVDSYSPSIQQYHVLSSDNQDVTAAEWLASGAVLQYGLNYPQAGVVEGNRGFSLRLKGPIAEIPGKPGPYYFAYTDGTDKFAALVIGGPGVKTTPETLSIGTGATIYDSQNPVKKVSPDNVFLATKHMAYDRGAWAVAIAGGPVMRLDVTLSIQDCLGFGLTCGTVFTYMEQNWRIEKCTISNGSYDITAVRFATAGELDALWAGHDAIDYDTAWDSHPAKDAIIRPFWSAP